MIEYHNEVTAWKAEYARLSTEIRLEKAELRKRQSQGQNIDGRQYGLSRLKAVATAMLIDRERIKELGINLWTLRAKERGK